MLRTRYFSVVLSIRYVLVFFFPLATVVSLWIISTLKKDEQHNIV